MQTNARQIIAQTAADVAQRAESGSPVRTGSLAGSWYVSGPGTASNYAEKRGIANNLNADALIVAEITPQSVGSSTTSPLTPGAVIASAVQHDLFVELGTRYMAPRPIMIPAAEATYGPFIAAMSHVADV